VGAGLREHPGTGLADAGRRARHEHHFAGEIQSESSLQRAPPSDRTRRRARVTGKVVLVTARRPASARPVPGVFAQSGAHVMVCGRNEERRSQCCRVDPRHRRARRVAAADVRAAGASDRLVADTVARLGALHVLVNNPAFSIRQFAVDTSDEQWLDTMAVNVNALFY